MRARCAVTVAVIVVGLLGIAMEAQAGWLGAGCWRCKYTDMTSSNARCDMVGHNETGEGTNCYEGYIGGWFCEPNGVLCYNTEVSGGGGGGGGTGGGSGSNCTVAQSANCPAECFSCQRTSF